jgi:hypothetical protein
MIEKIPFIVVSYLAKCCKLFRLSGPCHSDVLSSGVCFSVKSRITVRLRKYQFYSFHRSSNAMSSISLLEVCPRLRSGRTRVLQPRDSRLHFDTSCQDPIQAETYLLRLLDSSCPFAGSFDLQLLSLSQDLRETTRTKLTIVIP